MSPSSPLPFIEWLKIQNPNTVTYTETEIKNQRSKYRQYVGYLNSIGIK